MNIKYTFILAVILASLAGYIVSMQMGRPGGEDTPPEVWSVKEEEIERIDLSLPGEDKSASFVMGTDESWYFNDESRTPVDLKRWGGIVLLISGPQSKRMIARKASDLAEFGLTDPRLIISLGVRGRNDPVDVLIGDPTPQNDYYYVKLRHSDPLYMVNASFVEVYTRLVMEPPMPLIYQEKLKERLGKP